jgi:hypothetical protein
VSDSPERDAVAAPEIAAPADSPGAPGPESVSLDHPVLRAVTPLAALGLVALITGRVLSPALAGVGVGMGAAVAGLGLLGDVSSQVFAFAAMMMAIVSVMAASRSRLPLPVRVAALTLGGFAVLPTVWALHQQVPELSAFLVAGSVSLLALAASPSALAAPFARGPGMVVGLVGLGGVVRLVAVGVALEAGPLHASPLAATSRTIAAAALLCDAAAVAIALTWAAAGRQRLTSPVTMVVLAAALILTRQALAGQGADAHGIDLLCWRAATRLLSRPDAALPLGLAIFVSFLAVLAAVAALLARGPAALAPLRAGVALALAARGAVEMPPCALMLLVGALAIALTARDPQMLWASLGRLAPARSPR